MFRQRGSGDSLHLVVIAVVLIVAVFVTINLYGARNEIQKVGAPSSVQQ